MRPRWSLVMLALLLLAAPWGPGVLSSLPAAAGPMAQGPTPVTPPPPQRAPAPARAPAATGGLGFLAPPINLSHLTGQRPALLATAAALPDTWDWRANGKVTPVKDQGACGACYAFAAVANIESRLLMDGEPAFDFSENNAKECNWPAAQGSGGSCAGGNYPMVASLFSQRGLVDESCDRYSPSNVSCNTSCPYQKTLRDWRMISEQAIPDPEVLKQYIYTYGPIFTTIYVDYAQGFSSYDGSYTISYTTPANTGTNHAVLLAGWSDRLPPVQGSSQPSSGWIVKNSWGTAWGDRGYFYITYGSANIGMFSSFAAELQDYDPDGHVLSYDEGGWNTSYGYGSTTAWGLSVFTAPQSANVDSVEFWTGDTATVSAYVYDNFDAAAGTLGRLLGSRPNQYFAEAGYHSIAWPNPLPVSTGSKVVVVLKVVDDTYTYPIAADNQDTPTTGRTYLSPSGANGSWSDTGGPEGAHLAIRLRLAARALDRHIYLPAIQHGY